MPRAGIKGSNMSLIAGCEFCGSLIKFISNNRHYGNKTHPHLFLSLLVT